MFLGILLTVQLFTLITAQRLRPMSLLAKKIPFQQPQSTLDWRFYPKKGLSRHYMTKPMENQAGFQSLAPPQESYSWPQYVSTVLTRSKGINSYNLASANRLLSHPDFPSNISLTLDTLKSALVMNQDVMVKAIMSKSISPPWETPLNSLEMFEKYINEHQCYSAMLHVTNVTRIVQNQNVLSCIETFMHDKEFGLASDLARRMTDYPHDDSDAEFLREFTIQVLEMRISHDDSKRQFYEPLLTIFTNDTDISPYLSHLTTLLATSSGFESLTVDYLENNVRLLVSLFETHHLDSKFIHSFIRQYFIDMVDSELYVSLDHFHPDTFGKFFEQSDLPMVILTRLNQKSHLTIELLNFFLDFIKKFHHEIGPNSKQEAFELGEKLLTRVDLKNSTLKARMDLLKMFDQKTNDSRQGFMNLVENSPQFLHTCTINNVKIIVRDLLSDSNEHFWRFLLLNLNLIMEVREEYLPFFRWLDNQPIFKKGGFEKKLMIQHDPQQVSLLIELAKKRKSTIDVSLYEDLILNAFDQAKSIEVASEIYRGLRLLHEHEFNDIQMVLLRAFEYELHIQKDKRKLVWYLYFMSGHLSSKSQPLTIYPHLRVGHGLTRTFSPRLVMLARSLPSLPYDEFKCAVTMAFCRLELHYLIEKAPLLLNYEPFVHLVISLLDPQSEYVKKRPELREFYRTALESLAAFLLLNE